MDYETIQQKITKRQIEHFLINKNPCALFKTQKLMINIQQVITKHFCSYSKSNVRKRNRNKINWQKLRNQD